MPRAGSVIRAASAECTNRPARHRRTLKTPRGAGAHARPMGTTVAGARARQSPNFGWQERTQAGTINRGREHLSRSLRRHHEGGLVCVCVGR